MVLLAKAMRLLWPITVLPNEQVPGWPVFGLLGLLRGTKWEPATNPKWHQRPIVIYVSLLATLPVGHAFYAFTAATKLAPLTSAMFAITVFGLQPLVRWLKQLEQDRRNAIAQEHAAQAQIIIMEKARAAHFEAQAAELSAAYAAQTATLAQVRQHNARILHANHDIMQPLFWLSSAVQKAANTSTEAAVTEILGIALRGAHEVTDMISDVFHQVTLENSGQTVLPQVLQVSQLKQYFWDRFYDLAQAHQIQLAMGNEAFAVLVHKPRLRRVIANLLNNAISPRHACVVPANPWARGRHPKFHHERREYQTFCPGAYWHSRAIR